MDDSQRTIIAIRLEKCVEDMATAREDMGRGRYSAAHRQFVKFTDSWSYQHDTN